MSSSINDFIMKTMNVSVFVFILLLFVIFENGKTVRRRKRSLSMDKFNELQANWNYLDREVKAMFDKYYECIENANKRENRINEAITAVLALEGQRIELECVTCLRPDQDSGKARLFWQRVRNSDASTTHIRPDTPGIKIKDDMTLIIKQVDVSHAGQYFCVKDGDAEVIYQVDVLFKEAQRTVPENDSASLLPAQLLTDHNLKVYTHWSGWGECDRCGEGGQRLKYGTCMVQKIDKDKPITPMDIPILALYPTGVPCRSTVLTRPVAHLPGIYDRQSEILKGDCFESCPTTPAPIEVTDQSGKVIEVIPGGYHPIENPPELPPMIQRKVLYKPTGLHLALTCPTSETGKVRWERGERVINPATIRLQTKGRVYIDNLNRLHVTDLRIKDSAPYNCWVWQRQLATFKVIAYQPMNENLKNYITYGGLFLTILGIPLYCICKLCSRKPRPRRK